MVYIYNKKIGNKNYYYLRASTRKGSKILTKDIAYLGSSIEEIKKNLANLPSEYSEQIRKAYKTINKFIEINHYLQKVKALKIKKDIYLDNNLLENIEACKLHWNNVFKQLDNQTKKEILKNFLIEFAFNTASIEGNTITLKETQKLLMENLTPKNRTLREIYDLQNTEKVFFELFDSDTKLSHELICSVHDKLLENIDTRKGYRTTDVKILKMNFKSTPAPYVITDMNLLTEWYNKNKNTLHPLILAVIFHHKFEKIHPFMDGNGRTGRMLMNYILVNRGYPPLIIRKKNRTEYLGKLNKADRLGISEIKKEQYKNLINFIAKEAIEEYWNIFL